MGIWGIPDDVRKASLARLGPPPSPQSREDWVLNPGLEEELRDDLAQCDAVYGIDERARRASLVACLARLARDVRRHDETCIEADFILERALDAEAPPYSPAVDELVAEIRAFIRNALEPKAPIELLALDSLHAFLFEKLLLSGQPEAREAATRLAERVVAQAEGRGARFAKESHDVVADLVERLRRVGKAYRPRGRFGVASFLTQRFQYRLDDEKRRVGSMSYTPRRVREHKQAGRIPGDQVLSEEILCALNASAESARRHAVSADCLNCRTLWEILVKQHDEAEAEHECRTSLPLVIPRPDRTGLRARWIA